MKNPTFVSGRTLTLSAPFAALLLIAGFTLVAPAGRVAAAEVTLPDMQMQVPPNAISIAPDPATGHNMLRYTHVTWDAGTGPFEIDPTYNAATGTATFVQQLYSSPSPGVWVKDHTVPVAAAGVFIQPAHYRFPLTKFTLNTVNANGSIGAVAAASLKTDYCMTGDTLVGGVPNTPAQTFIPDPACEDPSSPLGWSVGWGDEYDQTDGGQPIDLAGIPDGTYILRGIADPQHVLTESDPTNNVSDTKLRIAGTSVTILSQSAPRVPPPAVVLTAPASAASLSGTVVASGTLTVSAAATTASPDRIASVQFLLDGQPLGTPVTTAPFDHKWTVGTTAPGSHTLSALATDSTGNAGTAVPAQLNVMTVQANAATGAATSAPTPATTAPTVSLVNPAPEQTVSGTIHVAANASDDVALSSVQFFLDGQPLGNPRTTAPYATDWDTTKAAAGHHILSAQAKNSAGRPGTAPDVNVRVQNPAPPMTCFVLQTQSNAHGTGTVTTPAFQTAATGEILLAFVSTDGPQGPQKQSATLSGAGLAWQLMGRSNSQTGDAEIWQATAPSILSGATVTSVPAKAGYVQSLTVIAYEGMTGAGAVVVGSGDTGAPEVSLTTQGAASLVFAVGNDQNSAAVHKLPTGNVMLDQFVGTGNTFWTEYTNQDTGPAGSTLKIGASAPTTDQWNMVAVELLNSGD